MVLSALNTLLFGRTEQKRVVTPLQLQMHSAECGAACLQIVLGYFGRWTTLAELRVRCDVSRDGSTAAGLVRAANHFGLNASGLCTDAESLRKLDLPLILFWDNCHFVVLEGWDRKFFWINDPAYGRRRVSIADFSDSFSRIALRFEKSEAFSEGGERPNIVFGIGDWIPNYLQVTALLAGLGIITGLISLAVPMLSGYFLDSYVVDRNINGLLVAAALLAAGIAAYLVNLVRERIFGRISSISSIMGYDKYFSRLMRLPVEYFIHRFTGDLAIRVLSVDGIAQGIAYNCGRFVADFAVTVVLVAAIFFVEPLLGIAISSLGLISALLSWIVIVRRSDASHALKREQGTLLGIGTLIAQSADFIRMTSSDDTLFARWCAHQAREQSARQRYSEFSNANGAIPLLFTAVAGALVLAVEAPQISIGESTPGQMLTLLILSGMCLGPIGRFVEFFDLKQSLDSDMQRLDEIVATDTDSEVARRFSQASKVHTHKGRLCLAGHLEMRNVTFGHQRNGPLLIKNFNLRIRPGQRVAIVGASGSGKSTVARLVAGVFEPFSGDILFDGAPRNDIHPDVLARSISMVDQNIILFSATIRENITLWNSIYTDSAVVAAAKDACIHDEILQRSDGYAALVNEGGANFSGGQRQRLEIARALVGNPSLLILDEATSALDVMTEERVDDALRRRGVSCLIIAHRLSTVRDCDEIIVLDDGSEVERGTHSDLVNISDGIYRRLLESG